MTTLPTWAVVLYSGRVVAVGATDEDHARAVYGYPHDIRDVVLYDPLVHLTGRDLAQWKEATGYVEPEETNQVGWTPPVTEETHVG